MHSDQRYSVYVAGIPTKTTKKEISSYFSQFGPITSVETFENDEASGTSAAGSKRIKGYCVISTYSKQAYASILGYPEHMMFGRGILCAKYQEGSKLMRLNRLNNQKRVVIKIVNGDLKQEELKSFLDINAGKVEVLHELKPDHFMSAPGSASSDAKTKQFTSCGASNTVSCKSFSVMFADKFHAQVLISKGSLQGPRNNILTIERFKPQSKKIGDATLASTAPYSSTSQTQKTTLASESNTHSNWTKKPASSCRTTFFVNSSDSTPPHCHTSTVSTVKPTSKLYSVLRNAQLPQSMITMMLDSHHHIGNLRFNKKINRKHHFDFEASLGISRIPIMGF